LQAAESRYFYVVEPKAKKVGQENVPVQIFLAFFFEQDVEQDTENDITDKKRKAAQGPVKEPYRLPG